MEHPTDDASYESFDAGLGWPGGKVRRLFDRLSRCRTPDTCPALFVGACRVAAGSGGTSYGEVFALGYSARQLLDLPGTVRQGDIVVAAVGTVGQEKIPLKMVMPAPVA